MACPFPDRDDGTADGGSFNVNETQQLYKCFGCDARGNSFQLQKRLGGQGDSPLVAPLLKKGDGNTRYLSRKLPQLQGVTVAQLAQAKSLGWTDTNYGITPAIRIPYFDENGKDPLVRYRGGQGGQRPPQ